MCMALEGEKNCSVWYNKPGNGSEMAGINNFVLTNFKFVSIFQIKMMHF